MLKEVTGDILLTKADALAHGVAPNDNFANGLALALRERWPAMYKDFRHYSQTFTPKTGELWTWAGVGGVRIVNLYTQEAAVSHGAKPGPATIENVNHCLKALSKMMEAEKLKSIALPRLATGVGGLDWKDVKPLIHKHLGHLSIPVYVYATYRPGVQAEEKG
jgi:O-acetyl-ADP-ribose deacetylase (regulator of RNase III)